MLHIGKSLDKLKEKAWINLCVYNRVNIQDKSFLYVYVITYVLF